MNPGTTSQIGAKVRRIIAHPVARNAALMYLVQFSSYVFPLLTLPYLARVLSTDVFGLVAFAQIFIWYFVTLTEYGFNLTATRAISVARESPEKVNRIFNAVMAAKLLLTLAGLVILIAVVLAVPGLRPHAMLYLVSFLAVIGNLLFPLWLYQGLEKMQHVALRDFAAKLLSLAVVFAFVRGDGDYLLAAGAQSVGLLVAGAIGLARVGQVGVRFSVPEWADVKGQFREGWPAFISLAVSAGAAVTNTVMLGFLAPVSEVAFYSGPQRIIAALRTMVAPLSTAIYPHASKKAADSEEESLRFVQKYAWMFAAPFAAIGLVLTVGSPWLVPLFFGPKYAASVPVLQVMAFIPALLSLTQSYSTYYMLACGYDKEWMRVVLTTVAVNLGLFLGLMAAMRGSMAIAVAALLTEGTATFLYWRFFRRRSRELGVR